MIMAPTNNIVIIGGGVIGLTSAICIQNAYPKVQVTVITADSSPNTTADGSAGFWLPYLLGSTPQDKILQWSKKTYDHWFNIWQSGYAEENGICFIPVYRFFSEDTPENYPKWLSVCHGVHKVNPQQLKKFAEEHNRNYKDAICFTSFICEPTKYLPFLLKQFQSSGGVFIDNCRINQLSDISDEEMKRFGLSNVDIVINCTGIGARKFVPDHEVHSIRGQVARVKAPWQYHVISSNENYIIPNIESVVLGGTHQEHNYCTSVHKDDTYKIFNGCFELVPGLQTSPVQEEWVGLRPARNSVRLEMEKLSIFGRSQPLTVIHNYGHGGAGVTLSWGCALDVVDLLKDIFNDTHHVRSRL